MINDGFGKSKFSLDMMKKLKRIVLMKKVTACLLDCIKIFSVFAITFWRGLASIVWVILGVRLLENVSGVDVLSGLSTNYLVVMVLFAFVFHYIISRKEMVKGDK